ncbi:MAG: hypothetical protein Q9169_001716 [Polycauliona sp. 2 TL-2023]
MSGRANLTAEPQAGRDQEKLEQSDQATKQQAEISMFDGIAHKIQRSGRPNPPHRTLKYSMASLQNLVGAKASLRSKLSICKAAQTECAFEIAFAVLPPRSLKPISNTSMKKLVANVVAVIGACESKFALLGEDAEPGGNVTKPSSLNSETIDEDKGQASKYGSIIQKRPLQGDKTKIELVKPKREIEFGDIRLLQHLLQRITVPYTNFDAAISRAVQCVTIYIAYSYDVSKLPSGARVPKELAIEEVDLCLEELGEALRTFDTEIGAAFDGTVELPEVNGQQQDFVPREEIFLVASFVLNLRQAATHIEQMLKTSRSIVLQRHARHGRRRFYAPRIKWSKWLYSGGEDVEALPASSGKQSRSNETKEKTRDVSMTDAVGSEGVLDRSTSSKQDLEQGTRSAQSAPRPRQQSKTKPTPAAKQGHNVGLSLRLRARLADGLEWAQDSDDLLYAFKISVAVFLVTWPAFIADWNQWYSLNRGLWAPLQLVFITEVSIGAATDVFLRRWVTFVIGGTVALVVEIGFLPVKARTRLVESLSAAIREISEMETCIAAGIEEGVNIDVYHPEALEQFERASGNANRALTAAEMFCESYKTVEQAIPRANVTQVPFCSIEPRVKGSFEGLARVYSEAQIYPYRRNVAGSINLTLFAVQNSLTTKLALPQFFPSARLAHLRMINRVREVVQQRQHREAIERISEPIKSESVRQNYLAWNAASAARAEIIEYLEELIDLTKLLVGANEFRSGLLMRDTYNDYVQGLNGVGARKTDSRSDDNTNGEPIVETRSQGEDGLAEAGLQRFGTMRRRRLTTIGSMGSTEDKVPASLQRIQSRKTEAGIKRQTTNEGWNR